VVDRAVQTNSDLNEANFKSLVPEAYAHVMSRKIEKVAATIYSSVKAKVTLEEAKKYNNPSSVKVNTPPPASDSKPKSADELLDPFYKEMGLID
jgi:hypothetical protein